MESQVRRTANIVASRNLRQHVLNVSNWKLIFGIAPNYFEFLPDTGRLKPTRRFESLSHPLRNRHPARACCALNFPVFRIFDYYLQPFAHTITMYASCRRAKLMQEGRQYT